MEDNNQPRNNAWNWLQDVSKAAAVGVGRFGGLTLNALQAIGQGAANTVRAAQPYVSAGFQSVQRAATPSVLQVGLNAAGEGAGSSRAGAAAQSSRSGQAESEKETEIILDEEQYFDALDRQLQSRGEPPRKKQKTVNISMESSETGLHRNFSSLSTLAGSPITSSGRSPARRLDFSQDTPQNSQVESGAPAGIFSPRTDVSSNLNAVQQRLLSISNSSSVPASSPAANSGISPLDSVSQAAHLSNTPVQPSSSAPATPQNHTFQTQSSERSNISTVSMEQAELDESLRQVLKCKDLLLSSILERDFDPLVTVSRAIAMLKTVKFTLTDPRIGISSVEVALDQVTRMIGQLTKGYGDNCPDQVWNKFLHSLRFIEIFLSNKKSTLQLAQVAHLTPQASPSAGSVVSPGGDAVNDTLIKAALSGLPAMNLKKFDNWLDQFEQVTVRNLKLPLEHIKIILSTKFATELGPQMRTVNELNSWAEMREYLTQQLSSTPTVLQMFNKWKTLSQGSKSILEYNSEVADLLHKTENTQDTYNKDRIHSYVMGLREPTLQRRLMGKLEDERPLSMAQAFKLARQHCNINDMLTEQGAVTGAYAASFSGPSPRAGAGNVRDKSKINNPDAPCVLHPGSRHTNRQCNAPYWNCVYCKKQGTQEEFESGRHAKECPAQKCHICGRPGHQARNCHQNPDRTPRKERGESRFGSRNGDRQRSRSHSPRRVFPKSPKVFTRKVTIAEPENEESRD